MFCFLYYYTLRVGIWEKHILTNLESLGIFLVGVEMAEKIAQKTLLKSIPKRKTLSNKSDGGVVLVIAGGAKFMGAGLLSALACTRSGAGYTHLMTDLVRYPWVKFPDFIIHKFSLATLKKHQESVIAIGPGLGTEKSKVSYVRTLLKMKAERVILDADALTIVSQMKIKKLPASWVLTPHEAELARLLHVPVRNVKNNREYYLNEAHRRFGCVIVLKGHETLLASKGKITYASFGSVALAKAGTGDVLLGVIAALRAQGLEAYPAAALGVLIHGTAAKDWEKKGNDHLGLRPTDLIDQIPQTIKRLRSTAKGN